jgi:hypothetical protein
MVGKILVDGIYKTVNSDQKEPEDGIAEQRKPLEPCNGLGRAGSVAIRARIRPSRADDGFRVRPYP